MSEGGRRQVAMGEHVAEAHFEDELGPVEGVLLVAPFRHRLRHVGEDGPHMAVPGRHQPDRISEHGLSPPPG